MNSRTTTALTTRRNAYHKPMLAAVKRVYEGFKARVRMNAHNQYGHHHKGEPRN